MSFTPAEFWKNFSLGTELQNSGTFLYNGILVLDNIEYFRFEEECFELLYNLSIGIERLEKILIILLEHSESNSQKDFEKSLITHNHLDLLKRIENKRELNLGKVHRKFLNLLTGFYKKTRYERFNLSSIFKPYQEKEKLTEFLKHELKLEFTKYPIQVLENTDRVKKFLGKIIQRICINLYELIRSESYRLGIFTHEVRYNSKAYKIFIEQEFDFRNERLMQREVILHLLRNPHDEAFKKFESTITPLKFENFHTNYYIQSILNIQKDTSVKDEMIHLYEENKEFYIEDRTSVILAIGSNNSFDFFNEDDTNF